MNFHLYKTHLGLEIKPGSFLALTLSLAVIILNKRGISARLVIDVRRDSWMFSLLS